MPLPLVGAKLVLENQRGYMRDAENIRNKTGLIGKALRGMGEAGIHGGSMVTGALTAVMGPVGILVQGTGKLVKGFIGLAAEGGSLRGIQVVFDNLSASYGLNADLLDRLRSSTKGAVDDFELMRQVNKALVGAGDEFGKMFGERLPLLMQVSREAAKAQGQSVEYMFDSIVTGIKRSSPMILDNLGFQFSLTEANEKYAASIGKTVKELTKEEKQIALLNAVTDASAKLIEQTGGSVDTAAKQALSWRTELTNLRKYMAVELEPILMSVMGLIGKPGAGARSISGAIVLATRAIVQKIVPAIDAFGVKLRGFISGPLTTFIQAISAIGLGGFKEIGQNFSKIFSGVEMPSFRLMGINLKSALAPVLGPQTAKEISDRVVGIFEEVARKVQGVRGFLDPVRQEIEEVFLTIGDVVRAFISLSPGDFPWEDIFPPGIADLMYQVSDAFEKVVTFIRESAPKIESALKNVDFGVLFQDIIGYAEKIYPVISKAMSIISPAGLLMEAFKRKGTDLFKGIADSGKKYLGSLLTLVKNVGGTIVDLFEEYWPDIENIVNTVFEGVLDIFMIWVEEVVPLFLEAANMVLEWFNDNWPAIADIIDQVFGTILGIITEVVEAVVPFIVSRFQGIVDWAKAKFPEFQETIKVVLDFVLKVVQNFLTGVEKFWDAHGKKISAIVEKVWNIVQTVIDTVIKIIQEVIEAVMAAIRGDWEEVWESIGEILDAAWQLFKDVVEEGAGIIQDVLELAWQLIKDGAAEAWRWITTTLSELWNGLVSTGKEIFDNFLASLVGENGIFARIVAKGEEIWEGFKEAVIGIFESLRDTVVDVWDGIKYALQAVWDSITGTVDEVWGKIKAAIFGAMNAIGNIISNAVAPIRAAWDSIWEGLSGIVKAIWNQVIDYVIGGVNSAIDVLNGLIDAANKIPGVSIKKIGKLNPEDYYLAQGGILSKPVFAAGEAGPEIVSPLSTFSDMLQEAFVGAMRQVQESAATVNVYGPQQQVIYNNITQGGPSYQLTTQSTTRPGYLALEYESMEMANL